MKVLACVQWDHASQTCTQEAWIDPMPFGFPPLSAGEGAALGAAALVLFGIAWLLKRLRKTLETL